ncbi:LIM domain family protein [Acanthocheilonema viteae]
MEGFMDARCGKCSEIVKNDGFIANNRLWHCDHFHCSRCKANITREYYVDDGNVVCITCTLIRPTACHKCGSIINETYLEAMGYCWHQKCFLCYGCKKPFPSAKYRLLNGHPYDNDCYWGARLDAHYFVK